MTLKNYLQKYSEKLKLPWKLQWKAEIYNEKIKKTMKSWQIQRKAEITENFQWKVEMILNLQWKFKMTLNLQWKVEIIRSSVKSLWMIIHRMRHSVPVNLAIHDMIHSFYTDTYIHCKPDKS